MLKRLFFVLLAVLTFVALVEAQNSNSSTTTPRSRGQATPAPTAKPTPKPSSTPKPATTGGNKATAPATGPADAVLEAFHRIIDGVRHANVNEATSGYLNSSSLVLFNYNGTVTKGWAQMRKNRESSYPDIKDVKLETHDEHVIMLGRDGAVVTALWTQTQTYKGAPDSASGRMTLVFKRVGTEWKAVHLHTSPDKPDASRIPASEQTPSPGASPTPAASPSPATKP